MKHQRLECYTPNTQHSKLDTLLLQRLGLVPRLLGFMEPEGSHCSSHLALLVKLLIECGDLDMAELQGLGLGSKVTCPPSP
jgi:hypothetical protein